MKKFNKTYDFEIYFGAPHAFNNDAIKEQYHPEAAKEAWERTRGFLQKHLKA